MSYQISRTVYITYQPTKNTLNLNPTKNLPNPTIPTTDPTRNTNTLPLEGLANPQGIAAWHFHVLLNG